MDMFLMTLLALDFKDIFAMCVFLGIWFYIAYWVITAFFSSPRRHESAGSPLTGNGGGQFHSLNEKSSEPVPDVLDRIRSEGF